MKYVVAVLIGILLSCVYGIREMEMRKKWDEPKNYGRISIPYPYRDKSLSDYGIKIPKGEIYTGISFVGNEPYYIDAAVEDLQRQIKELQSKKKTTRKQLRELKEEAELEKYLGL